MFRKLFCYLFTLLFFPMLWSQPKTDSLLHSILVSSQNKTLIDVITHAADFRCAVIYTEINRDKNNRPSFKNHYFHYDAKSYFNPASMVKLPLAALALEKLNKLHKKGVTKYTTIQFDSSYEGQTSLHFDSTAENGLPSIAHFIKRAFLISENDPYNRLYQFVGQQEINRSLHQKGYATARISRQFMGFTEKQNRHTNAVRFLDKQAKLLYHQPAAYNTDSFDVSTPVKIGKAHYNRDDVLIEEPFDFTRHNFLSLNDLQQILQSLLFPASAPAKQRFQLSKDDHRFLLQYLSQYPSETSYPKYDTSIFYDSYVKFFFRDASRRMPPHVRVFNKAGWAYGFLTDVSYVADFKNGVEFMLAATVYANSDGILNDNKYDYDSIGYPFLYALGQTIYNYELRRKRAFTSDLSQFKIEYGERDPNDQRPAITEADN